MEKALPYTSTMASTQWVWELTVRYLKSSIFRLASTENNGPLIQGVLLGTVKILFARHVLCHTESTFIGISAIELVHEHNESTLGTCGRVDDDAHVNLGVFYAAFHFLDKNLLSCPLKFNYLCIFHVDVLAATLARHRSKPRVYNGCMKSGHVQQLGHPPHLQQLPLDGIQNQS
ncbi:hypothetical protein ACFE04_029743 [Oxalis oulophora]